MPVSRTRWLFIAAMLFVTSVEADEELLIQRVTELEKRVSALEQHLKELDGTDRWKDVILWQRLKKGMGADEVRKLLGSANRIDEQVFTTWYYHPTSKLHSYVWFDEGNVLGWELPQ